MDQGKVEEANVLLLNMRNESIHANTLAYNSLINGYCKYGDMKKALDLCSQEGNREGEVVFLLFNFGLELSVERLSSMKKYVFGFDTAQVLVTAAVIGLVAHFLSGFLGPASIVIGNGLTLSSMAVVLQV